MVLDDARRARRGEHVRREGLRDGQVDADVHALAGGEPVGLDDVRRRDPGQVRGGLRSVRQRHRRRGRHSRRGHDLLGEALAALQRGGRGRRPEAGHPGGADGVGDPGHQRRLGPDDHQVRGEPRHQLQHGTGVGGVDRLGVVEPRVARRADHPLHGRVAAQRLDEGVLARAGAEDEDLHAGDASGRGRISGVESAVLIAVPEAEPVVGPWRAQGDPAAAKGVPPHVTLLFPFVDDPDVGTVEELRWYFAGVDGFPLDLVGVERFPGGATWLAPAPAGTCRDLTTALHRRWPDHPPYGGAFPTVVPHLTVVAEGDDDLHARAREAVLPQLPLRTVVRAAELWVRRPAGGWEQRAVLPMAEVDPDD